MALLVPILMVRESLVFDIDLGCWCWSARGAPVAVDPEPLNWHRCRDGRATIGRYVRSEAIPL